VPSTSGTRRGRRRRAWLNQQALEHGLRPLEVEAYLLNETLGYGGTCDLIAEIDGEVWLLDWKTGSRSPGRTARCTTTTGCSSRRTPTPSSSPGRRPGALPDAGDHRFGIVHVTDGGTRLYEATSPSATGSRSGPACGSTWRKGKAAA
jgi:hypothetical protein